MDIRKSKINIFSNSKDIADFLKNKNIFNYEIYFNPINDSEIQQNTHLLSSTDSFDEDINVLILNADLVNLENKKKWLNYKERYNYVFIYGVYNFFIYRNEFDIYFNSFNIFKEFFEIFYYLYNGVDFCSIYIEDFLNILGSRPHSLKIYTFNNKKELVDFFEKYTDVVNGLLYINKSTNSNFNIYEYADERNRIDIIIPTKVTNTILFLDTSIISEENNECWEKLLIV